MKIPKTTFFKDYDDNRYVVFYDTNGHLVEYIYELWARKSASNPQNYYSTVKDVFLCNKLASKLNRLILMDMYLFIITIIGKLVAMTLNIKSFRFQISRLY